MIFFNFQIVVDYYSYPKNSERKQQFKNQYVVVDAIFKAILTFLTIPKLTLTTVTTKSQKRACFAMGGNVHFFMRSTVC
jgi:hypothetical protein